MNTLYEIPRVQILPAGKDTIEVRFRDEGWLRPDCHSLSEDEMAELLRRLNVEAGRGGFEDARRLLAEFLPDEARTQSPHSSNTSYKSDKDREIERLKAEAEAAAEANKAEIERLKAWLFDQREQSAVSVAAKASDKMSLDAQAVAVKVANPEWSDQRVAEEIGCRRETLFKPNMVNYKRAKAALKAGRDKYRNGTPNDRRRKPSNIDRRDRDD